MQYTLKEPDRETAALTVDLEPVVRGLGFALVELDLYRSKKRVSGGSQSARVRLVITAPPGTEKRGPGITELALVHRAVIPRLELALAGADISLEVSSPGTDRLIKEGAEFRHFTGRRIKCWKSGAAEWLCGILRSHDTEKILLETGDGTEELRYETIAKARLDG